MSSDDMNAPDRVGLDLARDPASMIQLIAWRLGLPVIGDMNKLYNEITKEIDRLREVETQGGLGPK